MKSQVCVIGSFNVDIISYLPRLPTIGESLLASNFIFSPGEKVVTKRWQQALPILMFIS